MRPLRCFGVLVIFTSIHPSTDPKIKVKKMLTGINHLQGQHNKLKEGNYELNFSPPKNKNNFRQAL